MSSKLSKIIDQLAKKQPKIFGDIENSATIKKCKIDSPQLSFLFGGGVPIGRIIRFRGPESSGKSIISSYCAGQLQKRVPEIFGNPDKDKIVYIDFERTFDSKFASQVGVNTSPSKFIHLLPDDIESANDTVCELIKSDEIAAIIFDSDAAAPPRQMATDPSGKANFGAGAKALGEFLKKVNILLANYSTTMFWISQERVNMCLSKNSIVEWDYVN
jgi:RecA/RadA recombinase